MKITASFQLLIVAVLIFGLVMTSCGGVEQTTTSPKDDTTTEAPMVDTTELPTVENTEGLTTETTEELTTETTEDSNVETEHVEEIIPEVAPTCTQNGYTAGAKCSLCGEITIAQEEIPALGHTGGEVVMENNVEADCTNHGSYDTVVYCEVCGDEISRTETIIEALGHAPEESVVENYIEADCTNNGSYDTVVYCEVCGDEISRTETIIEALGHTELAEVSPAEAPTCTKDGKTAVVGCANCNYTEGGDPIPATGHDEVHHIIKESTDKVEGMKKVTCNNCDYEVYKIIPVKDGNFTGGGVWV